MQKKTAGFFYSARDHAVRVFLMSEPRDRLVFFLWVFVGDRKRNNFFFGDKFILGIIYFLLGEQGGVLLSTGWYDTVYVWFIYSMKRRMSSVKCVYGYTYICSHQEAKMLWIRYSYEKRFCEWSSYTSSCMGVDLKDRWGQSLEGVDNKKSSAVARKPRTVVFFLFSLLDFSFFPRRKKHALLWYHMHGW